LPRNRRNPQSLATESFTRTAAESIYDSVFVNYTSNTTSATFTTREEVEEEGVYMGVMKIVINGEDETRETTNLPRFWRVRGSALYLDQTRLSRSFPSNGTYDLENNQECNVYSSVMKEIWEWAETNNVILSPYNTSSYSFSNEVREYSFFRSFISEFFVYDANYSTGTRSWNYPENVICGTCNHENDYHNTICEECHNLIYCPNCSDNNHISRVMYNFDDGEWGCLNCTTLCENCGVRYNGEYCQNCSYYCETCGENHSEEDTIVIVVNPDAFSLEETQRQNYVRYCIRCANNTCRCCGMLVETFYNDEDMFCVNCAIRGNNQEDYDFGNEEVANIPTIPGREMIRRCGVEIEGANGHNARGGNAAGEILARKLFEENLSDYDHVLQWNSDGGGTFAYMKHDGTVDWEMVMGPINMADNSDVRALNKSVKIIRNAIKDGTAKLDLRSGTHIHVGAEKVGLAQAYNLHVLFSYMEDVLYRLGSAKWPVHRAVVNGDAHCRKADKENSKMSFANRYSNNRYYGLSFSNYFNAMLNNCRCGARQYGMWEECSCGTLGKCTFEFRLFNSTANVTKLHAYLAICQALVAKAVGMEEIKNDQKYPSLSFIEKRVLDMTENQREILLDDWKPRLRFISGLPLTEKEKNSIYYCIMNSELEPVGSSFLEGGQ
jgi:hypothetical protein